MTETVVAVEPSQQPEDEAAAAAIDVSEARAVDELEVARELVRQAREAGVVLTGPGGLLKAMTKTVIETALDEELSEHLGYDRHNPAGHGSGNSRNGTRSKTVLTDSCGSIDIDVPRDRAGTFEPHIVKKRQRRLTDVDEVILSLYARGLTTGEISAHFADIYGAEVSKDTISRITDRVVEEMTAWHTRPLERVYAAVFIDALHVKIRDGQVGPRPNTVQLRLHGCSLWGMPRAGWRKPESDRRLSDLVSVGVLTRVFPAALVDEVIAEAGRTQLRHRSLPARVMAYFAIAMGLYSEGSYEDVLTQLTDGLAWASGWREHYRLPGKSAIFQARERLGSAPLAGLFSRVARPLAGPDTPGAWLAGRRLVAVDGTCLDVADTVDNDEYFGRPGVNKGEKAAFPQARVVALAECATHVVFAARIGTYRDSETALAEPLLTALGTGTLLLADRGFFSYALWRKASSTGADLLWRVQNGYRGPAPAHVQDLPDGSWLAHLQGQKDPHSTPMLARVIDYTIDDGRDNPTTYRLLTTLIDPEQAPAVELAAAYAQRWEIENTFDELKTHQRGPRVVLRSKSPDLVLQEIWGHLCCHYAIRVLMAQAAEHAGHDPDRVSFTAALRIVRQSVAQQGAFPP